MLLNWISHETMHIIEAHSYYASIKALIDMASMTDNPEIPWAAVVLSDSGLVTLHINPNTWHNLTPYEQAFILCHESLHIIFGHFKRFEGKDQGRANIATDCVINSMLVDPKGFKFEKGMLSFGEKLYWTETAYEKLGLPLPSLAEVTSETIYDLLPPSPESPGLVTWDIPNDSGLGKAISGTADGALEKDAKIEEQHDRKSVEGQSPDGEFSGLLDQILKGGKRQSWIKLLVNDVLGVTNPGDAFTWAREDRKLGEMIGLSLPGMLENERGTGKMTISLFIDVSGSCSALVPMFVDAYHSIPKEYFDVSVFTFSTEVAPAEVVGNALKGRTGGGTTFTCIEEYIKAHISPYPKHVWVFTDGDGNKVKPARPERWTWFLSKWIISCIPAQSKRHKLSSFAGLT